MRNPLESSKLTLPLLVTYVTELTTTLNEKAALSVDDAPTNHISNNSHDDSNKNDKNADLLWVMEDKAALARLNAQGHTNEAANYTDATTLVALAKQTTYSRYQLACFWLPTLTEDTLQPYIPLLMRYRDLYAAHLIIALSQDIDWRHYGLLPFSVFGDEQAAGLNSLKPLNSLQSTEIMLWQFNLYDYKQLPNWLNSDYWANPENWDKRRW